MKAMSYWQQFTNTGRIEDYLSYIDHQDNTRNDKERQEQNLGKHSEEYSGEYPYAAVCKCDRNDIEAGTYRGI